MKYADYVNAGIGTYKVEKVKYFKFGCNDVEFYIVNTNDILFTDDLLNTIGILMSYPTDELCISLIVIVYLLPATISTIKDWGSLNELNPTVYYLFKYTVTDLFTELDEAIAFKGMYIRS